jgi:hypothetical protein
MENGGRRQARERFRFGRDANQIATLDRSFKVTARLRQYVCFKLLAYRKGVLRQIPPIFPYVFDDL